jgi:maltose O-acetyltransferase
VLSSLRRAALASAFRLTPATRLFGVRRVLLRWRGFRVGEEVRVTSSARFLLARVSIGNGSFVGHEFRAYGGPDSVLAIGERCDIGPRVTVLAGSHKIGDATRRAGMGSGSRVQIGDASWIGGAATLVGPCTVGSGAIVAAGATVRGTVPPNCVYKSEYDITPLSAD